MEKDSWPLLRSLLHKKRDNPAKQIGRRFSRNDLIRHLELINSKYRIEDMAQYFPL